MSLFSELQRRNVFRVAIGYLVSSWLLLEVADVLLGTFGTPDWVMQTLTVVLALGFPVVVFFSWAYEVTPEGIKRESEIDRDQSITHVTARKLDRSIMMVLAIAVAYFAFDKFYLSQDSEPAPGATTSQEITADASEAPAVPQAKPGDEVHPDQSIAVLPFVNMSEEEANAYFADGLSEELLNLLAKIPQLQVAARTSSFALKDEALDIPEIGQRLKVAHVLEGSVRKAGNQVRITAQLVQARDGYHLWSETYDRELDDIFAIQDEIAAAVVDELKVQLLGAAPAAQQTEPEAYALYLQARQLGRQNSVEALERSNALYQEVLSIDPNYAPAWDGLALNSVQQASMITVAVDEGFPRALQAADRAIELDPALAGPHAIKGYIALSRGRDMERAARHLERAMALEPGNIEVLRNLSALYRTLARLDEAIAVSEVMVRLDPLNNNAHYTLGLMLRYSGRLDEAIAAFQRSLSLSPERVGVHSLIGEAQMLNGDAETALESVMREQSLWRIISLPMVYYALGRVDEADATLAELIDEHPRDAAYNIAYVYAHRGDADRAFEWLEKAVEYDDPGLGDLPIESLFENIHDDPRWLPLLERLGKSPAQLDAVEFNVKLPD